jgi:hypothetical protein
LLRLELGDGFALGPAVGEKKAAQALAGFGKAVARPAATSIRVWPRSNVGATPKTVSNPTACRPQRLNQWASPDNDLVVRSEYFWRRGRCGIAK